MSNRDAFDATLEVLAGLGRINPVDEAHVELVRHLASAVDDHPGNANLAKQYREALSELVKADDDVDSSLADALAALERATEVGDPSEAGT